MEEFIKEYIIVFGIIALIYSAGLVSSIFLFLYGDLVLKNEDTKSSIKAFAWVFLSWYSLPFQYRRIKNGEKYTMKQILTFIAVSLLLIPILLLIGYVDECYLNRDLPYYAIKFIFYLAGAAITFFLIFAIFIELKLRYKKYKGGE